MGFAVAKRLADLGAKVAIGDINWDSAQKAAASIGHACLAIKLDTGDGESVKNAIAQVEEKYGGLDFAANCAAIQGAVGPIIDLEADDIARVTAVNLNGIIFCLKYEILAMKKRGGGAIVSIASVAGNQPMAYVGPYSASKAGVIAITKTAAAEVGADHIRVNSISPGYIDTPMMRAAKIEPSWAAVRTPNQRCGVPDDVADLVTFLLSEDAKQIHGVDVPIDGGLIVGHSVRPPGY